MISPSKKVVKWGYSWRNEKKNLIKLHEISLWLKIISHQSYADLRTCERGNLRLPKLPKPLFKIWDWEWNFKTLGWKEAHKNWTLTLIKQVCETLRFEHNFWNLISGFFTCDLLKVDVSYPSSHKRHHKEIKGEYDPKGGSWMGSHFHNRIDYNGVVPLIEYLKWGHIFTIWGVRKFR